MEVTIAEAKRPDVNVRLTAEEADVLKAYFGELNRNLISKAFEDFDDENEHTTKTLQLTADIFEALCSIED